MSLLYIIIIDIIDINGIIIIVCWVWSIKGLIRNFGKALIAAMFP